MDSLWTAKTIVLIFAIAYSALGQHRGPRQFCKLPEANGGICVPINRCPFAINQLRRNRRPPICGFQGVRPIVCCPLGRPANIVTPNVSDGTKSKQKCEEYSSIMLKSSTSAPVFVPAIVGGINSLAKEFPHMAALGFGSESSIRWSCGGSLISEIYVLTAAHCVSNQELGDVQFVRLGDLNIESTTDDASPQQFRVVQRIVHPDYVQPNQYHDIALLKLDKPVEYTEYVRPACLQLTLDVSNALLIATGWGTIEYGGITSDHLQKVNLEYFTNEQCRITYTPQSRLENGIVDDIQVCAGGVNEEKDTCQGDSGGPLQIKISSSPKMYSIVGITSFGKACGITNTPGVYTRVSHYISWIEEIVWPN